MVAGVLGGGEAVVGETLKGKHRDGIGLNTDCVTAQLCTHDKTVQNHTHARTRVHTMIGKSANGVLIAPLSVSWFRCCIIVMQMSPLST